MKKTLVLIPCAGYGKRMKMKPNKSKELLIDPSTKKPLIEWHLNICKKYKLDPLIITRAEKKDLIKYCKKKKVKCLVIKPKGEWTNTLLASKKEWRANNLILLPDSKFSPEKSLQICEENLREYDFKSVFGIHKVKDMQNWGCIEGRMLCEKPTTVSEDNNAFAWGLFGFKKEYGELLLNQMAKKEWFYLKRFGTTWLSEFKDLTRSGKVE